LIYLHIGRNKAGSTTLQDFFLHNRAVLEQNNIRYALYSHLKDSVPGVLGFAHQLDIKDYAHAHPDVNLLISSEWMFYFNEFHTSSVADALRGLPVKVIAYIRPYHSWVCSSYAQDIRSGESRDDFDAYFESLRPRFAVWPCLRRWGEQMGWDNIVVRLIDRQNTPWDRITEDFLTLLGLEPDIGVPVPASNRGTHWAITELLRALAGNGVGLGETRELTKLLENALDADPHFDRDIQYLTPVQGAELAAVYQDDFAKINAFTGAGIIPEPLPHLPERPFLPAFSHLPPAILRDFAARARARNFIALHPGAAAAAQGLGVLKEPFGARLRRMAAAIRRG
jgi:hypothetical protein